MRKRIYNWQGQRFGYIWLEGEPGQSLEKQSQGLFDRAGPELASLGLALDKNVVRTRVYGRTRDARNIVSAERGRVFSGQARAATSSFISSDHLDWYSDVALELWAMAAPTEGAPRKVTEMEPGGFHPASRLGSAGLSRRHDERRLADPQGAMRRNPAARRRASQGERLRLAQRGARLVHASQEREAAIGARYSLSDRAGAARKCRD